MRGRSKPTAFPPTNRSSAMWPGRRDALCRRRIGLLPAVRLVARADQQHRMVLAGDDRGIYGEYASSELVQSQYRAQTFVQFIACFSGRDCSRELSVNSGTAPSPRAGPGRFGRPLLLPRRPVPDLGRLDEENPPVDTGHNPPGSPKRIFRKWEV
jgi:hypothetical protein